MIQNSLKKFPTADWVNAATDGNMTIQECRSLEDTLTDQLLIDDKCVATVDDPELGPINQVGITYRMESSPGAIQGPTRATGADTDSIKAHAASMPELKSEATSAAPKNKGPLDGVRVLDLGLAIAGPFGCQLLSDMGAEVIKVEAPQGDDTRQWGPPFVEREDDRTAAYFHSCNRGQSSVVVHLRAEEGQAHRHDLGAPAETGVERIAPRRIEPAAAALTPRQQTETIDATIIGVSKP